METFLMPKVSSVFPGKISVNGGKMSVKLLEAPVESVCNGCNRPDNRKRIPPSPEGDRRRFR
jgi:hypothetical protein